MSSAKRAWWAVAFLCHKRGKAGCSTDCCRRKVCCASSKITPTKSNPIDFPEFFSLKPLLLHRDSKHWENKETMSVTTKTEEDGRENIGWKRFNLHPQEETKSNLRGKRKMKSAEGQGQALNNTSMNECVSTHICIFHRASGNLG